MTNANAARISTQANTQTPRWRLGSHDKITLDNEVDYVSVSDDEFGHVLRRVDNPNLTESFTHEIFQEMRSSKRMKVIRGFYLATAAKLRLPHGTDRITDLPSDQQIKVLWRKNICDRILRMVAEGAATLSDASLKAAISRIVADLLAIELAKGRCGSEDVKLKRPPSPRALRRWLKRYKAADYNAMAFVDGYSRCGDRISMRFGSEERALMRQFAEMYASSRKPTKANLLKDLLAEIDKQNKERATRFERPLIAPSRKAFERVIRELDPFLVEAGRTSPDAARKKFYIVRGGVDVTRPFERVELDENRIPLQALLMDAGLWAALPKEQRDKVERGRYWLSVAIDVATRCCVAALLVEKLSASTAVATLEMAVQDKSSYAAAAGCQYPWDMCGTPETIPQDSGSPFLSHEYCGAATDLGSELLFPPAGMPQMRGTNERFFKTLKKGLFSRIDGQTFENVVAKGEYDSQGRAVLDIAEIGRLIVKWIVDVYHNTRHAGLGGETPRDAWLRLSREYPPMLPPDEDVSRHIFGITVQKPISNQGVKVLGLRYQSMALQRLRNDVAGKPVLVRLNPADLGFISVRTSDGWLAVPCQRLGFDGVSVTHWLETELSLRRTNANMAKLSEPVVFQALREIQETADNAVRRAGIASPILGAADIAKFERDRFQGFAFARGPENGPSVLDDLDEPAVACNVVSNADQATDGPAAASDDAGGDDFFFED